MIVTETRRQKTAQVLLEGGRLSSTLDPLSSA